jgi:hypothetical protein
LTVHTNWPTGRRNLLASVIDHLIAQLPVGTTVLGSSYLQSVKFPCVSVEDLGLFALGDAAFDDLLSNDGAGGLVRGKIEQTQLEINIAAKLGGTDRSPVNEIRILHDQVYEALAMAGVTLPAITLKDYANSKADTGAIAWHPSELDNAWISTFIKDDGNPTVWRYRVYARIHWEMRRP